MTQQSTPAPVMDRRTDPDAADAATHRVSAGPYTLEIPANGVAVLYEADPAGDDRQLPGGVGYLDALVQFAGEVIRLRSMIDAMRADCNQQVQDFTQSHPSRKPPRVRGVGRMADEPRALLVLLTEIPTDDELRSMHEFLRAWRLDPRDSDHTRSGNFVLHNCWKCDDGQKPCVWGDPYGCEYPHARND